MAVASVLLPLMPISTRSLLRLDWEVRKVPFTNDVTPLSLRFLACRTVRYGSILDPAADSLDFVVVDTGLTKKDEQKSPAFGPNPLSC